MEAHDPANPHVSTTTAGAAGGRVAAGQVLLFSLRALNANGGRRYVQLFDAAGLPADGTVPAMVLQIEGNGLYEWHCHGTPRGFRTGVVWGLSSTGNIHTLANPECWLEAQFFRL